MRPSVSLVLAVASAAITVSCHRGPAGDAAPPAGDAPPRLSPAQLSAIAESAQRAFREDHGTFTALGDHHALQVRPDGSAVIATGHSLRAGGLTVRTARIGRDKVAEPAAGGASLEPSGAVALRRSASVERWVNRADGVEQSWTFASRPPGRGDLQVVVELQGLRLRRAEPSALLFAAADRSPGLRYGDVAWVDARGLRTRLTLAWEGRRARMVVPAALVDGSAYPAVLDPTIQPEHSMDQPLVGPAFERQGTAAMAGNSNSYLVVWEDRRNLFNEDIYGELFSRFGRPSSSSAGLPIAPDTKSIQRNPAVAYNGSRFLVVWGDDRNSDDDIYGAFVENTGAVSAAFQITPNASGQSYPSVAADPTTGEFLVTWIDTRAGSNQVWGGRVNGSTGALMDGSGFRISGLTGSGNNPTATFDGTYFVVAWQDGRNAKVQIYAGRISTAGVRQDGDGVQLYATTFNQTYPSIGGGGAQSFTVWQESRDGGAADVFGRMYSSSGVLQSAVTVRAVSGSQTNPRVAYDGTRYWVAYQTDGTGTSEINLQRVLTDGTVQSATRVPTDGGNFYEPALAGSANDIGVAFDDYLYSGHGDVSYSRCMDNGFGGIRCDDFAHPQVSIISQAANVQFAPAAAWDGTGYLVAWCDSRNWQDGVDIYGIHVDATGTPKEAQAFKIGGGPNDQYFPHVAFGGGTFLVTWSDPSRSAGRYELWGARVGSTGGVLDSPPLVIADAGSNSSLDETISYDGQAFLIAYEPAYQRIALAKVTPGGAVLTPPSGIPALPDGGNGPRLAFDGTNHLLTFYRGPLGNSEVWAARVRRDGGLVDPDGFPVSQGAALRLVPDVAFDGQRYLVTWTESRASGLDLMGASVTTSGTASAPQPLRVSPTWEYTAGIGFDGEKLVLAWDDVDLDAGTIVRMAGWIADGGAIGPEAAISADYTYMILRKPELAPADNGSTLMPYNRQVLQPGVNADRVMVRVADALNALGASCSSGDQCRSGYCADGVCCETACGGGDPTDCQVCAAGTGLCGPLPSTTVCRASTGVCDPEERCNGVSVACPGDAKLSAGTICESSTGPCDLPGMCDGASATCPGHQIAPATYVCRPAQGGCDVPELCDGVSISCPSDQIATAGTVCRAAASSCDLDEVCNGGNVECPTDVLLPDGTVCGDNGICQSGACNTDRQSYYGWHCGCSSEAGLPLAAAALLWLGLRRRSRAARRLSRGTLAVALLAAWASSAPARAEESLSRLLMLGITPRAGFTPEQAETAASFIQSELASFHAYRVTGPAEVAAIIGMERQRQLLGCSENGAACVAELAGALDADRALSGDVGYLGDQQILNLTLVDARSTKPIHRVAVRAPKTASMEALLDGVRPALYELITRDVTRRGPAEISYERGFGGIVASVRAEGELARLAATPAISLELSTRYYGGAITVIAQPYPGIRAEGRFYPLEVGRVRPYVALGATTFIPAVGGRVAVGAAYRWQRLQISADVAYEQFFNPAPGYLANAALLGLAAGWQF